MEKKDFRIPNDNQLRISKRKNVGKWVFLSKIYLKHFKEIELHALGDAINIAVRTAESLKRKGLCAFLKVETRTVELERRPHPDAKPSEGSENMRKIKKHKVVVIRLLSSWRRRRNLSRLRKILRLILWKRRKQRKWMVSP